MAARSSKITAANVTTQTSAAAKGPALVGPTFMLKWEMQSVERLFHKIRDTMPEVGSSDVTDAQKLDTVAFILQQNGFPAGTTELTDTRDALAAIRMMPKTGPGPPRSGALVQAVGCLQKGTGTAVELDRQHRSAGDHPRSADAGRQTGIVFGTAGQSDD